MQVKGLRWDSLIYSLQIWIYIFLLFCLLLIGMFLLFIFQDDRLMNTITISWLIHGYHSSILEWNHFRTSNEIIVLTRIPTIKSSCLLDLFTINGLGPLYVQVLCLINSHKKQQGYRTCTKLLSLGFQGIHLHLVFIGYYSNYITRILQGHSLYWINFLIFSTQSFYN
jgi:hypothetical protein